MAISYNNQITAKYHGRIGDIVLRHFGDRSVISKRPNCSKVIRSKAQLTNQKKFKQAIKYAEHVYADEELYVQYAKMKKKNRSVWNVVISDYMLMPVIVDIELGNYEGVPGNVVSISAWDKYKIERVSVLIKNMMGELIESGDAEVRESSGGRMWDYRVTKENQNYTGGKIEVCAYDRPGNKISKEIILGVT